jgi:hypothetical protein
MPRMFTNLANTVGSRQGRYMQADACLPAGRQDTVCGVVRHWWFL